MENLEKCKWELQYYTRLVESLKQHIAFLEGKKEKEFLQKILNIKGVVGINNLKKIIFTTEFSEELRTYKDNGWSIQKEIF